MKVQYCIECAEPLTQKSKTDYMCSDGHYFWNNSKATAVIALRKGDKILFSKRAYEPRKGMYDLPGGFCEYGESFFETATRELKEELGIHAKEFKFLTVYALEYDNNISVNDIILLTDSWEGEIVPTDDVESVMWESPDFIENEVFGPDYPGLSDILKKEING